MISEIAAPARKIHISSRRCSNKETALGGPVIGIETGVGSIFTGITRVWPRLTIWISAILPNGVSLTSRCKSSTWRTGCPWKQ